MYTSIFSILFSILLFYSLLFYILIFYSLLYSSILFSSLLYSTILLTCCLVLQSASEEEKSNGTAIANLVSPGRKQVSVVEGKEPEDFWAALGGKGPYTTVQPDPVPILEPRLFHCILSASGRLGVEEIKPFKQQVSSHWFFFFWRSSLNFDFVSLI